MSEAPNKIAFYRKMRKMTQQMLASALGVHVITISNLERGRLWLSQEWQEKIAAALQIEPDALLIKSKAKPIYVGGFLSGRHMFYHGNDQPFFEVDVGTEYAFLTNDNPRWVLVRDNSMYPALRIGDIVRAITLIPSEDKDLLVADGKFGLIYTETDGDVVGFMAMGTKPKHLHITPLNEPTRFDVKPELLHVFDQVHYQPDLPPGLIEFLDEMMKDSEVANKLVD